MSNENGSLDASETVSMMWTVLACAGIGWYAILWTVVLVGWISVRRRYTIRPRSPLSSPPPPDNPESVPGVSILRPLKGLDPNLYENLESTFQQEYPQERFEILFCVADPEDQALGVVNELLAKYPHVNAKAVVGERVIGVNPKVNNLMEAYDRAEHDILWVLDSNIWSAPGTLARSVDALTQDCTPRIGLVHHVPFVPPSAPLMAWGARVEAAFLNTTHAKMYVAINTVAIESCVMGKSNMYRRSDVARVNASLKPHPPISPAPRFGSPSENQTGLAAFGKFLAEDAMLGSALWHELGVRHSLSCDVALNTLPPTMPLSAYIARRVRWIRVRKAMVLIATLLEPLTEGLTAGVLAAWSVRHLGLPVPWFIFMSLHFSAWLLLDLQVYSALATHPVPNDQIMAFCIAWVLREVLAFPIWLRAVVGSEVEWRGTKYQMRKNGEVDRVDSDLLEKPRWQRSWARFWRNLGLGGTSPKSGYEALPTQ
ncbi:glycosyltransferase family 21 protein [Ceratobasidium sp. AG-Ba]|nr:glycosyltransferase family 21 protein [Ceratobasidium sp. AG-Ba]